jgi:hypothetical protein
MHACLQSAVDLSELLELLSSVERKLTSDPRFPKLVADHDMRLRGSVARKRPARAAAREYGYGARPLAFAIDARTHAMHVSDQQPTHDDMLAEAAATELPPPCCRGGARGSAAAGAEAPGLPPVRAGSAQGAGGGAAAGSPGDAAGALGERSVSAICVAPRLFRLRFTYPGRVCSGQAIRVRVEIMGLIMTRTTILHFCDPIISPPAPVLRAEAARQDVIDRRTTGAASASSPQSMHGGGGRPGVGPESSSLLSAGYMVVGASGSHMSAGSMPTPERQLTHDLQRVFHSEQRPMQMSRGGGAPQPSGSSSEQPPPAAVGPGQPSSHQ